MEQSYVAEDILMVGANTCTCALYLMKVFLDVFLNIHVQYPDLSFLLSQLFLFQTIMYNFAPWVHYCLRVRDNLTKCSKFCC